MSTMLIQSGTLDDIADAIRSKTGKVASMTPLEMPDEIESISGGGGGLPILSGITDPTSSQGTDGQIYLKCGENGVDLSTFTFRNTGGVTCVSTKYSLNYTYNSGASIAAESNLQMDLTNVDELKFTLSKGNKNYDNNRYICVYIENQYNPSSNWVNTKGLTPDAIVSTNDTTQSFTVDVSSYTGNYWIVVSSHGCSSVFRDLIVDGQVVENYIIGSKLKVNDAWQDLMYSDIDDVILSVGGVTKKKNLIISNDINASTLLEQVVDENLEVTNVFAGTYNSEANAYQTDLIKYFYDTVGTYGHQYYWHVIAKTNVTCDGTDYVAGDIIDYWYYNVKKTLLVEES